MQSPNARILYVEDDADTRELVSFVLARANYEVVIAENPEQVARLARTASFDLYLIDKPDARRIWHRVVWLLAGV